MDETVVMLFENGMIAFGHPSFCFSVYIVTFEDTTNYV